MGVFVALLPGRLCFPLQRFHQLIRATCLLPTPIFFDLLVLVLAHLPQKRVIALLPTFLDLHYLRKHVLPLCDTLADIPELLLRDLHLILLLDLQHQIQILRHPRINVIRRELDVGFEAFVARVVHLILQRFVLAAPFEAAFGLTALGHPGRDEAGGGRVLGGFGAVGLPAKQLDPSLAGPGLLEPLVEDEAQHLLLILNRLQRVVLLSILSD